MSAGTSEVVQGIALLGGTVLLVLSGLVSGVAIAAGLHDFGLAWWLSALIAFSVAYAPFLGGFAGAYFTYTSFGWPLLASALLAVGPDKLWIYACSAFYKPVSKAYDVHQED